MTSGLNLGSSAKLVEQSDNMQDELDRIKRTIEDIYVTFDNLKLSWKGQKADECKKIIEEARLPLKYICDSIQTKNTAIRNVGEILSDYNNM